MELKKAEAIADGKFAGIQIVAGYMKDRWNNLIDPILPNPQTGHRDACIKSLYLRALAWMQTLEKMNHAVCFQAVVSSNRSLLEIAVDLILLHHDKSNHSGWKMYCWGLSEKLKGCEETVSFYQDSNLELPDQYEPRRDFIQREKWNIEHFRKALWPTKTGHPRRWTGQDLKADIREADRLYGNLVKDELGVILSELYVTEFRQMSWQVHSGIAGVNNLPADTFNLLCGIAFMRSADLGMLSTKIVLNDFGLTAQLPKLRDEWDRLKEGRTKSFCDIQLQKLGTLEL